MPEDLNSVVPFSLGSPLATRKRMQHSQSLRSLAIRYLDCCNYQDRSAYKISRYNSPTSLKIILQTLKGEDTKSIYLTMFHIQLHWIQSILNCSETPGKVAVVCNYDFENCNAFHNSHDLFLGFCCLKLLVGRLYLLNRFARCTGRTHMSCSLCHSKALLIGGKSSRNEKVKPNFQNVSVMPLVQARV